ncbi:uncharacterized protein LOC132178401 [Corylus avellana]|uniref:uncharacterized protein LOC132178401 n=1 Tax=Corylus avellana TaxID=13451 RepID=UPI001E21DA09|nr:uncharacterized protein LOC132178401 [Corylus avellana]
MEDLNMLAADCVVVSCCCQCLILQIVIFVLLKLPSKLIRKTREYARKKLRQRKEVVGGRITGGREMGKYKDGFFVGSLGIQVERLGMDGGHHHGCMEEVEKVLEELSQKGEFAFGSFWGRKGSGSFTSCEFDDINVEYQIIEMIGSFSYT